MSTSASDVVVTGLGATTPLGGDVVSTWEALLAGRSGVSRITGWQVGVVAEYSLFDGGVNKARINQAEIKLSQVGQSELQVQQLIEFEVRSAYLNMKEAEKLIKVAEEGIKNSQESFRIAQLKYNEGIATNTEVIDAQSTLIEAETNHLNALYDYNINRAALVKAMGMYN